MKKCTPQQPSCVLFCRLARDYAKSEFVRFIVGRLRELQKTAKEPTAQEMSFEGEL